MTLKGHTATTNIKWYITIKYYENILHMFSILEPIRVLSVLVDMGIFFTNFLPFHPAIFYSNGERWKGNHNSSFSDENKENNYYVNGGQKEKEKTTFREMVSPYKLLERVDQAFSLLKSKDILPI